MNMTTSTMITMITIAPKLMNMGCSSRVSAAQDGVPDPVEPAARIQAARRDVS
jgi:hypothetical protein